jgi:hypothetical protein
LLCANAGLAPKPTTATASRTTATARHIRPTACIALLLPALTGASGIVILYTRTQN